MASAANSIPVELRFFLQEEMGSAMPVAAYYKVLNRDPMVFFSSIYLLLPLVLLPAGAALAWAKSEGAWDTRSMIIKPIAWIAVLYVPLGYALFTFNLFGMDGQLVRIDGHVISWDDFSSAALLGRCRLLALSTGFALWATLPIVGVAKHMASRAATRD